MIFYRSFFEALKELPDSNRLEMFDAICEYGLNFQQANNLSGISKAIFTLIKPQIEANIKRYENGSQPKNKQKISNIEAKNKQDISKEEANSNDNQNLNAKDNQIANQVGKSEFDFSNFSTQETQAIHEWLTYKKEKKQAYKPTGLKALRTKLLELKLRNVLVDSIGYSMSMSYNGIFDPPQLRGKSIVTKTTENDEVHIPNFANLNEDFYETRSPRN